jgi:GNAT superfamily N-acetyltransferase
MAAMLRRALRRDLTSIVDVWVDAFAADPYLRWIQPDDARWPEFGTAWMTFVANLCSERGDTYLADPPDAAIAWIPPGAVLVGPDDIARGHAIIAAHAGESRADDALAAIVSARGHDLAGPHWTLQYLGVRASKQGCGLGAAVVAPVLGRCDEERLPCGLVSTSPRNVPFYVRHGFRTVAEVATPDAAVTLRPMHRPAS